VICNDIAGDYEHKDSNEDVRMYQMPLTGENFKQDNKLVYASYVEICWCEARMPGHGSRTTTSPQTPVAVPGCRYLDIMTGRANSANVSKRSKEEFSRLHLIRTKRPSLLNAMSRS
jgi:hypothetical protein